MVVVGVEVRKGKAPATKEAEESTGEWGEK